MSTSGGPNHGHIRLQDMFLQGEGTTLATVESASFGIRGWLCGCDLTPVFEKC